MLLTAAALWMLSFIIDPATAAIDSGSRVPALLYMVAYGYFLNWAYWTVCWALSGRTIGNLIMGIRVVNRKGERLGWGVAALRSAFCAFFPIGLLWVVLSGGEPLGSGRRPAHERDLRLGRRSADARESAGKDSVCTRGGRGGVLAWQAPCSSTSTTAPAGTSDMRALCDQMISAKLTAQAMTALAEDHGYVGRVGSIDGVPQAVTMDYRDDRFTLAVTAAVVTACTYG